MKSLTVLYDSECGFCVRCRAWLERQKAFVPLKFLPRNSLEAKLQFPNLDFGDELIAITEDGGVYRGTQAWIMCLYALEEYRALSLRLAHPSMLPLARHIYKTVSRNRKSLSQWLGLRSEEELNRMISQLTI